MIELQPYQKYRCRFSLRDKHNGQPMRNGVDQFQGMETEFQCFMRADEQDQYPGEFMMLPTDKTLREQLIKLGVDYVSSGDLTVLEVPAD